MGKSDEEKAKELVKKAQENLAKIKVKNQLFRLEALTAFVDSLQLDLVKTSSEKLPPKFRDEMVSYIDKRIEESNKKKTEVKTKKQPELIK